VFPSPRLTADHGRGNAEPDRWHAGYIPNVCIVGTVSYADERELPELVERAVRLAVAMKFELSCHPAQGRLLSLPTRGRPGAVIGETGTGCGVGLAWMLSAADPSTRLVSVEADDERAAAVRDLYSGYDQVTIVHGDWPAILPHGPFDLLVLDGGGSGKIRDDERRIDPQTTLRPAGTLVMDDWTPWDTWPPDDDNDFEQSRLYWLQHPDLLASEIRLSPSLSTIIATRH
jgi:predicted O-methyltransferase YrrM